MTTTSWTPMIEPIHGPVPEGRPPWKDNAFIAFWDTKVDLFGSAHVSTSPNAEGRRARFSVSLGGKVIEVVDELDPGTFTSERVSFEMGAPITVDSPRFSGAVEQHPLFGLADYATGSKVLPELVPGEPMAHYQHPVAVTGTLTVDGEQVEVDGFGVRDRTWGYRDESTNMAEYIGVMSVFPDRAISVVRMRSTADQEFTEGFVVDPDGGAAPIRTVTVTRDASSLCAGLDIELADGSELVVSDVRRRGGFWVPMGWSRKGPSLGEFDEFSDLTLVDANGNTSTGFGMIAHGIMRTMF